MNEDQTVVLIVAVAISFITLLFCLLCAYFVYVRWAKLPLIHPATISPTEVGKPHQNPHPEKETEKQNGDVDKKENGAVVPQTLLFYNGQVIKPQLCISQDTLAMYRKMCTLDSRVMMAPPRKVRALYEEKNMREFHQEHRRAFGSLDSVRESRKNIMGSRSYVSMCSALTESSIVLREQTGKEQEHEQEEHVKKNEGVGATENDSISVETSQTVNTHRAFDTRLSYEAGLTPFKVDDAISVREPVNVSNNESTKEPNIEPVNVHVKKQAQPVLEQVSEDHSRPLSRQPSCISETLIDHFVKPCDVDIGAV